MLGTLFLVLGVLAVLGVGGAITALSLANNLLYICEPNEVLVFSGTGPQGFRIIKGGRGWRVPLIERVDRLDLTNMIIEVNVSGAYSKGGIPLNVQGVANVKIDGHDALNNAVERLLSKPREEVVRMAKDVLEGNLRGVLSQLTPEEVNTDKIAFAQQLLEEADHDLAKLGLKLDTMKIQNVHDDRGYLDSIGRKSSAEIIRNSRIAEARAKAAAIIRDADNRQRARMQQIDAEQQISVAQAERRIADAQTRAQAIMAEQTGKVEAEIAKAEAAIAAETARVEQVRRQLEADVLEPARAAMEAGVADAKGRAARITEDGQATVKVLEDMIEVWRAAGPNARDIFLMQKLNTVMAAMVDTISNVKVDKITMLPSGGNGSGDTARTAVRLVEELKGALGVDLPELLKSAAGAKGTRQIVDAD
ncbi:MAG: flotillin family protein [Alphaproteobacteria bacterium]|nr:flotillin family protein [Alphaproteobacteria bacterium]